MSAPTLPDPQDHPEADVVIFDGQCRFCTAGVRQLRRLDLTGRLAFLSLHDPRVGRRYPDLTHDQLMDQMYVISGDQKYGGSEAVKYLSRRLPALWLAMPLLHVPGTAGLYRRMYAAVARRRYQIAGKMGGPCEDACAVHFGDAKK